VERLLDGEAHVARAAGRDEDFEERRGHRGLGRRRQAPVGVLLEGVDGAVEALADERDAVA